MKIKLLAFLLLSSAATFVSAQTQFAAINHAPRLEKKLNFSNPLNGKVTDQATMRRYATNCNRPGVIQFGLGWGTVIGGAVLTQTVTPMSVSIDDDDTGGVSTGELGVGITNNFNFRFQVGVSEPLSLGFYARKDIGNYVTELEDFDLNGFSFGFEAKYYFINNDYFAVYAAPTVGWSMANTSIDTFSGKGVGLNYGITVGLNWYWTDAFGMSCDLGYRRATLAGLFDVYDPDLVDEGYKIRYGGLYFGLGLVMKFDTNTY